MNKISSMLDKIADSLESNGLIREAYEIDKIADSVEEKYITSGSTANAVKPGNFIVAVTVGGVLNRFHILERKEDIKNVVYGLPKNSCVFGEVVNVLSDGPSYEKFVKDGPSKKNWYTYFAITTSFGKITHYDRYEDEEDMVKNIEEWEGLGGSGVAVIVAGFMGKK